MVQKELASDPTLLCLSFNGWLFEGFEDAKTALMGTILDSIQERVEKEKTISEKGAELLTKLRKRVDWLHVAGLAGRYALSALIGLPHLAVANLGYDTVKALGDKMKNLDVDGAKKLLKETPEGEENVRRNIRDFREDFKVLLAESKIKTLVVFIDDLDRCLPDTIIETLEAIKLFLFVPGTAFVLGADERLIEYAVRRRFPELPGTETEVGRDYLEKLIQIPLRIPPLSGAEIESYMNLLAAQIRLEQSDYERVCEEVAKFHPSNISDLSFDLEVCRRLLGSKPVPPDLESDLDLTVQIAPVLTPGLGGNPRRTKRFLNTLLLRLALGKDRGLALQRQTLAKLMLLEYLRPEFFKQLARLQAAQDGKPGELAEAEMFLRQPAPEQAADRKAEGAASAEPASKKEATVTARTAKTKSAVTEDTLPADVQPWLADSWMRAWIGSEPALSGTDLRPYFYIAHDKVGALQGAQTRLSPAAREILNKLLDNGLATQELGLRESEKLGGPDATAVFDSLAQRIRQAESLDEKSPQKVLFGLMAKRPELIPQLVALYSSLPDTKITLATTTSLYAITKDTSSGPAAQKLLQRWSTSTKSVLAKAAGATLARAVSRTSKNVQ